MENQSSSQNSGNHSRTIVMDIARLIKQKKISKEELASLDKDLRDQATALSLDLPDEAETFSLKNIPQIKTEPKKGVESLRPTPLAEKVPEKETVKPVVKPVEKKEEIKIEVVKPKVVPTPPPAPTPVHFSNPVLDDKGLLDKTQKDISILEKEIAILMQDKAAKNKDFDSYVRQEDEIEKDEERIRRNIEEITAFKDKKVLEEQRWALEDKRQEVEKNRFKVNVEITEIDKEVLVKKYELSKLIAESKKLEDKLQKQQVIQAAEKAKVSLDAENVLYDEIIKKKKKNEEIWLNLKKEIQTIQDDFAKKDAFLADLKVKMKDLTIKEKQVNTEEIRHSLEEQRWALEKSIRETETTMWKIDNDLEIKNNSREELEKSFASMQIEQEQSVVRISNFKNIISKAENYK